MQKLQGDYRNFVVNGTRWESLRRNPDAMFIDAGRSAAFWPAYFRTDPGTGQTSNYYPWKEAYAEFLSIYLEEVVYGPAAFMPVASDRFFVELLNEPDLHLGSGFTALDMAEYHRDIAQTVRSSHPLAGIGGPSMAITVWEGNNFERWNNIMKVFIDVAGPEMDFYSIHPYERYDVQANGSHIRAVDQSPGRVDGLIDLMRNYHEIAHGNRLPLAFTEYGSFNWMYEGGGAPSAGNYSRDEQQWDLVRDVAEKMMVVIDRPDAMLSATPFISAIDWRNQDPTSLSTAALIVKATEVDPVVPADSYTFTRGTYSSGDVSDLAASDNSDLAGRRGSTDVLSRVFLEVKGTAPVELPSTLSLTVEASVFARSQVVQSIDLFDYENQVWEQVETGNASRFADTVSVGVAAGDLTRFIEPVTRSVEGRIRFQSPSNRQRFTANVDHVIWNIEP